MFACFVCLLDSRMYTHKHTLINVLSLLQGGVIVEQIFPEGVAAKDGRLRLGDWILEINEVDITHKTFAQTCLALGSTTPLLKLKVLRQSVDESVSSDSK